MFHENWYNDRQIKILKYTVYDVKHLHHGIIVEIGCWEGKSAVAIANSCYPEILYAVDTWKGNYDEDPDHPSVKIANRRDVFSDFECNINNLTKRNVEIFKQDCFDFLRYLEEYQISVKFCHIDASHDYNSVKKTIEMLLPRLVKGAIICGDDYGSGKHKRLHGGVKRAVKEMCPEHTTDRRFWRYKYKGK